VRVCASVGSLAEIAPHRDQRPDSLDDPERPGSGKKPIGARQRTPDREREHKPRIATLQRIHHHHERHDARTEDGQHQPARMSVEALTSQARFEATTELLPVQRA
jgi:hypothetical protein